MLLDFEKAFDSLSWEYIQKSLKLFNCSDKIISWVKSLQLNSSSKILQNGHLSKKKFVEGMEAGWPGLTLPVCFSSKILIWEYSGQYTYWGYQGLQLGA